MIDFLIYEKHWDYLKNKYGCFLDAKNLLEFMNEKSHIMSEPTFNRLPKNGIDLPVGIKTKGKWLFGLDAVVRYWLKMEKTKSENSDDSKNI